VFIWVGWLVVSESEALFGGFLLEKHVNIAYSGHVPVVGWPGIFTVYALIGFCSYHVEI